MAYAYAGETASGVPAKQIDVMFNLKWIENRGSSSTSFAFVY